jgi:FkbM family methyltransferase
MRAVTQYGVFNYFPVDHIGRHVASGQFWDPQLRPYLDALKPGDTFVDVGANIGFFSVYAAKARGAKVHAFEAAPEVCALLRMNIAENGLEFAVEVHECALFDAPVELGIMRPCPGWGDYPKLSDGRVDFERYWNSGSLCLEPVTGSDPVPYRMTAKTLDSFDFQELTLLKVDAQGCDLRILKGAQNTIKRCRPSILFEFEPQPAWVLGEVVEDYHSFLKAQHYEVTLVYEQTCGGNPTGTKDFLARYTGR